MSHPLDALSQEWDAWETRPHRSLNPENCRTILPDSIFDSWAARELLDPEYHRPILPNDVFDRWGKALVENLITGSETLKAFYCPFQRLLSNVELLIDDGNKAVQKSQCPYCKKVFCAQCKVPWHAKIDCVEFQKLNEDERGREDITEEPCTEGKTEEVSKLPILCCKEKWLLIHQMQGHE
ncbi:hypothetical protein ACLB2K_000842 [Fragaria x ananassa]